MIQRSLVKRVVCWRPFACSSLCALLLIMPARQAHAQDKPELGFSSDEVDADARMGELVLRGNVVVTFQRFRLTSPRLSLRRTARGIEVEGPGEVVFCPCPSPPVSIGFAGGLVGPPADLVLRHPQLRVGGVTVLGLPWFWLRAPTRAGVLPPMLAWRGRDGLLAGGGVHVPWHNGDGFDELDLTAAGYLKGGVELSARLRTARSSNRVRWDHLGSDLLAVDAHGVTGADAHGATVAWDADTVRGARARSASLQLGEAAMAYDRAAGETAMRLGDAAVIGVGVRAMAPRGGYGPGDTGMWGPKLTITGGGAIGSVGAWDATVDAASWAEGDRAPVHRARLLSGLSLNARPGWLATRLDLRGTLLAATSGTGSAFDGVGSGRVELSLPLTRAFATSAEPADAPLVHTIEPRVAAAWLGARRTGSAWNEMTDPRATHLAADGHTAVASVGGRTTLGRLYGRAAATVEGDVGAVAQLDDRAVTPRPVLRLRAAWSSALWALTVDAAEALGVDAGRVWIGKTRVGEAQGWHLAAHVAGGTGQDPRLARALLAGLAHEPSGGFLAAPGWSFGAEAGALLGGGVSAKVAFDEDWETRTLLQVRGAIGYAHPCRCVALDAYAGQRLGRDGVDVWVSIDLAPR